MSHVSTEDDDEATTIKFSGGNISRAQLNEIIEKRFLEQHMQEESGEDAPKKSKSKKTKGKPKPMFTKAGKPSSAASTEQKGTPLFMKRPLIFFVAICGDTGVLSLHAQECRMVKAWRKEHSLGLIPNFPTNLLQPPHESYAAREVDEAHIQELIESFEEKDSTNRKGIRQTWPWTRISGRLGVPLPMSSGRIFLRRAPRS